MKKTSNKLYFEMTIFFFIVILCFGLLIIKEKSASFKLNSAKEKITEYINNNYKDIKNELKKGKIKKNNKSYYMKIYNKKNKDLNFTINYKSKNITSTYKKDYLEGNSLFSILEKNMNNKLSEINNNKEYKNIKIKYDLKLNNCSDNIKEKLINKDYDLSLYTIVDKKSINLTKENLQTEIIKIHNYIISLGLSPKDYNLTYTDLNNETKSINVIINEEILKNNIDIGKIIIENDEKNLNLYNIKVKYLN